MTIRKKPKRKPIIYTQIGSVTVQQGPGRVVGSIVSKQIAGRRR